MCSFLSLLVYLFLLCFSMCSQSDVIGVAIEIEEDRFLYPRIIIAVARGDDRLPELHLSVEEAFFLLFYFSPSSKRLLFAEVSRIRSSMERSTKKKVKQKDIKKDKSDG